MDPNTAEVGLHADARSFLLVKTVVPTANLLPFVSKAALNAESKGVVATTIHLAAQRRIMAKTLNKKELSDLMVTVRRAGFAEGYAQAKLDMALGQVDEVPALEDTQRESDVAPELPIVTPSATPVTASTEGDDLYKTRTTVNTTKAIALDYIKSVAPKIVGPTEIKKNSEKKLNIFISFGTLKRAVVSLVEEGLIEQVEESRYRARPDAISLRSVK